VFGSGESRVMRSGARTEVKQGLAALCRNIMKHIVHPDNI
jgi:hypothetical protein